MKSTLRPAPAICRSKPNDLSFLISFAVRFVSDPIVEFAPLREADHARTPLCCAVCQQNLFASLWDNPTKKTSAVTTLSVPKSLTHDIQPA
jgi:hypothetical protein